MSSLMEPTPCFVMIITLEGQNAFLDNDKACHNGIFFVNFLSKLIPIVGEKRNNVSYHMENHAGVMYVIFDKTTFSMNGVVGYQNILNPFNKSSEGIDFQTHISVHEWDDYPFLCTGI